MLSILELLGLRGLDVTKNIKVARHKDTRIDVHELFAKEEFELYQSYQEKDRFKNCKYLVSCLGIPYNQALFVGVYEVKNTKKINGFPKDKNVSFQGKVKVESKYLYELEKMTGFEDLEGRLVIKWNEIGQLWCVNLKTREKEVAQILPKAFVRDFPGYNEVKLFHMEMKKIVQDPTSNPVWHKMLSSINAVYLIVDTTNGQQYVGSAYGQDGLFGRWKTYAQNGHGNNKKLMDILNNQPNRVNSFKYSILQTYPATLTKAEVIKEEMNYIDKLGTRAFGLNC